MIIRLYEKKEQVWVGDLDDLLEANQDLSTWQRRELAKLRPGYGFDLSDDFRVVRPDATTVPVIPRTPRGVDLSLSATEVRAVIDVLEDALRVDGGDLEAVGTIPAVLGRLKEQGGY
jgi:hypothetical protein